MNFLGFDENGKPILLDAATLEKGIVEAVMTGINAKLPELIAAALEAERPTEPSGRAKRYAVNNSFRPDNLKGNLHKFYTMIQDWRRTVPSRWTNGVRTAQRTGRPTEILGVKVMSPTIKSGREWKQQFLNNKTLLWLFGDNAALVDTMDTVEAILDAMVDRSYPMDTAGNYATSYKPHLDQVGIKRLLYVGHSELGDTEFSPSFGHTDYVPLERDLLAEPLADALEILDHNRDTNPRAQALFVRLLDHIENHHQARTEFLGKTIYKTDEVLQYGHNLRHPSIALFRYYKVLGRVTGKQKYTDLANRMFPMLIAEIEWFKSDGVEGMIWPHVVKPLAQLRNQYKDDEVPYGHHVVYTEESNYSVLFDALEDGTQFTLRHAKGLCNAIILCAPINGSWTGKVAQRINGNAKTNGEKGIFVVGKPKLSADMTAGAPDGSYSIIVTQRGGMLMAAPWSEHPSAEIIVDNLLTSASPQRRSLAFTKMLFEARRDGLLT